MPRTESYRWQLPPFGLTTATDTETVKVTQNFISDYVGCDMRLTTGAVGDNTGCVGRRTAQVAGQPAETFLAVLRLCSLVWRKVVQGVERGGEASENFLVQPGGDQD